MQTFEELLIHYLEKYLDAVLNNDPVLQKNLLDGLPWSDKWPTLYIYSKCYVNNTNKPFFSATTYYGTFFYHPTLSMENVSPLAVAALSGNPESTRLVLDRFPDHRNDLIQQAEKAIFIGLEKTKKFIIKNKHRTEGEISGFSFYDTGKNSDSGRSEYKCSSHHVDNHFLMMKQMRMLVDSLVHENKLTQYPRVWPSRWINGHEIKNWTSLIDAALTQDPEKVSEILGRYPNDRKKLLNQTVETIKLAVRFIVNEELKYLRREGVPVRYGVESQNLVEAGEFLCRTVHAENIPIFRTAAVKKLKLKKIMWVVSDIQTDNALISLYGELCPELTIRQFRPCCKSRGYPESRKSLVFSMQAKAMEIIGELRDGMRDDAIEKFRTCGLFSEDHITKGGVKNTWHDVFMRWHTEARKISLLHGINSFFRNKTFAELSETKVAQSILDYEWPRNQR